MQQKIAERLGCVPIYLKAAFADISKLKDCQSASELKEAKRIAEHIELFLSENDEPCDEMLVLTIDSINNNPNPMPEDIAIKFIYTEKIYQEIQYVRAIVFESWLSNVGGFSGIFLGYSMMQIPNFLVWIISLFHQKNIVKSKLDS